MTASSSSSASSLLRFSCSTFPCTPAQQEAAALPWGSLLTPLGALPAASVTNELSSAVPRCQECFAYASPFVTFVRGGWRCPLCRGHNPLEGRMASVDERRAMPALRLSDVEYRWVEDVADDDAAAAADSSTAAGASPSADSAASPPLSSDGEDDPSASWSTSAPSYAPSRQAGLSPPAYVLWIDLSADYNTLEVIKASLLALVESLPGSVWVGLGVVSSRVGLYDLRCRTPSVNYTSVRSASVALRHSRPLLTDALALPLSAILPLESFLQRLDLVKDNLCAAIESLASHRADDTVASASEGEERDFESGAAASPAASPSSSSPRAPRSSPFGFGSSLFGLLDYLSPSSLVPDEGQSNVRLLCFLSQRPNYGLGALVDRANPGLHGAAELNSDDHDRFLFAPSVAHSAWSGERPSTSASSSGEESAPTVEGGPVGAMYAALASAFGQRGVCIDLYALGNDSKGGSGSFDLASLQSLTTRTGGNLALYPSLSECTLPQDLYRAARGVAGWRCMLRVRCSPEITPARMHGHLTPDDALESLWHAGGCDGRKSYAIEWAFRGHNEGFRGGYVDSTPAVQIAFTYVGLFLDAASGVYRVEHRLRVLTRQPALAHWALPPSRGITAQVKRKMEADILAQAVGDLYASAAPEVVLSLLVHRCIAASREVGLARARDELKDFVVAFLVAYHRAFGTKKEGTAAAAAAPNADPDAPPSIDSLDLSLSSAERLQFLPRFVCALLKSPLLSLDPHALSADARVYLQCLYEGLEADYVVKSVYPTLSSFAVSGGASPASSPSNAAAAALPLSMHHPVLYLTRYSLTGCGDNVFVLDSFRQLIVLHIGVAATDSSAYPLPPAAHSDVARLLKRIKATTPYLTPKLLYCADSSLGLGGSYAAPSPSPVDPTLRQFYSQLLEDESGGATGGFSYATFLQKVGEEVLEAINEHE